MEITRYRRWTALIIVALSIQSMSAHGEQVHRIVLNNDSPFPITGYQLRRSAGSPWITAPFGSSLPSGSVRAIALPETLPCIVDVRVTLSNGASSILSGVNSCDTNWKGALNIPPNVPPIEGDNPKPP